ARARCVAVVGGAAAATEAALTIRVQLAGLLMDQGDANRAIEIYRNTTRARPDSVVAWQGLVGAYTRQRDFSSALAAMRAMPANTYAAAAKDPGFLNAAAAVYSAGGPCAEAEDFLHRSLSLDRAPRR